MPSTSVVRHNVGSLEMSKGTPSTVHVSYKQNVVCAHVKRPKYQLQDLGVSSPIARAVKGGRSSLPPQRPTPASRIKSTISAPTPPLAASNRLSTPSTLTAAVESRSERLADSGSSASSTSSGLAQRRGIAGQPSSLSVSTRKSSSLASSGASSIPVPQRRSAATSKVSGTPKRVDMHPSPVAGTPRARMRQPPPPASPLCLAQTPRHFYTPENAAIVNIDIDKTPTMESRQPSSTSISALSSASTTSAYSSASSMARARAAEAERSRLIRQDAARPDDSESSCAPFLVPQNGPDVTLAWQPDTEIVDQDPAEEVWKTLERKMGRRLRGESVGDRGRWIVQALQENFQPTSATGVSDGVAQGCCGMEKTLSEFTVSAYSSMTDDEGTALFDMTAPLIPSVSSSAATPANTPCFRSDTLTRHRHIRRRHNASAMSRQTSSESALSHGSKLSTTTEESVKTDISQPVSGLMYRLDSHVISALSALQGAFDSPELDVALGLDDDDLIGPAIWDGSETPKKTAEGGLGLGMHIRLSSVYTLPTLPRSRQVPKSEEMFGSTAVREVMMVKDLDTGVMRAMSIRDSGQGGGNVSDDGESSP